MVNRTSKAFLAWLYFSIVSILLTSCSSARNSNVSETYNSETILRFAGLGYGETESPKVEASMRRCMKQEGFTYHGSNPLAGNPKFSRADSQDFIHEFGYGVATLYEVRRISFLLPPEQERDLSFDSKTGAESAYIKQFQVCAAKAYKAAYGSGVGQAQKTGRRLKEALSRLEQTDSFQLQTANWSMCMRKNGYAYQTPEQPMEDIGKALFPLINPDSDGNRKVSDDELRVSDIAIEKIRSRELTLARVDFDCRATEMKQYLADRNRLIDQALGNRSKE